MGNILGKNAKYANMASNVLLSNQTLRTINIDQFRLWGPYKRSENVIDIFAFFFLSTLLKRWNRKFSMLSLIFHFFWCYYELMSYRIEIKLNKFGIESKWNWGHIETICSQIIALFSKSVQNFDVAKYLEFLKIPIRLRSFRIIYRLTFICSNLSRMLIELMNDERCSLIFYFASLYFIIILYIL